MLWFEAATFSSKLFCSISSLACPVKDVGDHELYLSFKCENGTVRTIFSPIFDRWPSLVAPLPIFCQWSSSCSQMFQLLITCLKKAVCHFAIIFITRLCFTALWKTSAFEILSVHLIFSILLRNHISVAINLFLSAVINVHFSVLQEKRFNISSEYFESCGHCQFSITNAIQFFQGLFSFSINISSSLLPSSVMAKPKPLKAKHEHVSAFCSWLLCSLANFDPWFYQNFQFLRNHLHIKLLYFFILKHSTGFVSLFRSLQELCHLFLWCWDKYHQLKPLLQRF